MALLFADPCGLIYSTTAQATAGLYSVLSASIATSGLPAGNIGSTALKNVGDLRVAVPSSAGPYYFGFRFCPAAAIGAAQNFFCFFNTSSSDQQVTLQTNANGTITAKRGNGNGTVLGTSSLSAVLTQNVWCYVEFGLTCSATVGVVDIRINGVSVLHLTGQNTQGSSNSNIQGLEILGGNIANYVQDIYVADSTGAHNNTFLGDVHVSAYNATTDGTDTDYTPNGAATVADCVSAVTPTDSTVFASDATPGNKMSVNLASTAVTGTIAGVIGVARFKKTDAGTRTLRLFGLNGSEVDGGSIAPGTSYAYSTQVLETDPNTGIGWTTSGFNTLQLGVETLT